MFECERGKTGHHRTGYELVVSAMERLTLMHQQQSSDLSHRSDYEHYDYLGRFKTDQSGQPFTQARLDSLRREASVAKGKSNRADVTAGACFTLTHHTRAPHIPELTHENAFLLLEDGPDDAILPTLFALEPQLNWHYLFSQTPWAPYLTESPVLIETGRDSRFLNEAIKRLTQPEQLRGLVLESPHPLETVLSWARHRLTVQYGESNKALLRYYDPRVWHALCSNSDNAPGRAITNAHYWHTEGETGHWLSVAHPEPVALAAQPALSAAQMAALSALPASTTT